MSTAPTTKPTISVPIVAWPTVLLALINTAAYIEAMTLAVTGAIPLWVGLVCNTVFAYVAYTALHESVHRNVSRSRPRLNTFVGMLGALPLFHNVELHKLTHLGHHAHLNNPEKDTDHWVAGSNPVTVLARCSTLFLVHYVRGIGLARASSTASARLRRAAWQNALTLAPILAVGFLDAWTTALVVQIAPGLLAATILGLTFDWLPHHPHDNPDAHDGTRIIEAPGLMNRPLTLVYLWQNYHRVHHVRPTIPFYLYAQAHRAGVGSASVGSSLSN